MSRATQGDSTIAHYLDQGGIELSPVHLDECRRLGLALPERWDRAPDHVFPDATAVFVDRDHAVGDFAPNAMVLVGKLARSVPPEELLAYGFGDSRALPEWIDAHYDRDRHCGRPAATIGGRYRYQDRLLRARTRYTVVDTVVDQYLLQVTVTVLDGQWELLADDVDALFDGVTVHRP